MNISQVPDREPRDAALLQLGIRAKYAAESWAGTKPFLTGSLNGHPESGETPGPDIDWGTALGIKCLWATAAFARKGLKCLYVSGEEAAAQVRMRAQRLGLADAPGKLAADRLCARGRRRLTPPNEPSTSHAFKRAVTTALERA